MGIIYNLYVFEIKSTKVHNFAQKVVYIKDFKKSLIKSIEVYVSVQTSCVRTSILRHIVKTDKNLDMADRTFC